jgi:hypothetical protein
METSELFDIIPEIEDLINFAKFESDVEVPTKTGFVKVRLSILWEQEEFDIMKRSGDLYDPADMLTRMRFVKMETLVYAIKKIGEQIFSDKDKNKEEILKNKLRSYLRVSNPHIIDYLYDRYEQLKIKSKEYIDEKTDIFKKKYLEELKTLNPL